MITIYSYSFIWTKGNFAIVCTIISDRGNVSQITLNIYRISICVSICTFRYRCILTIDNFNSFFSFCTDVLVTICSQVGQVCIGYTSDFSQNRLIRAVFHNIAITICVSHRYFIRFSISINCSVAYFVGTLCDVFFSSLHFIQLVKVNCICTIRTRSYINNFITTIVKTSISQCNICCSTTCRSSDCYTTIVNFSATNC